MISLFDEEYIQKAYGKEKHDEGYHEGIAIGEARGVAIGEARGEAKGILETLISLVKDGVLSIKDASTRAKMSEAEFSALVSQA